VTPPPAPLFFALSKHKKHAAGFGAVIAAIIMLAAVALFG